MAGTVPVMSQNLTTDARAAVTAGWDQLLDHPAFSRRVMIDPTNVGHAHNPYPSEVQHCPFGDRKARGDELVERTLTLRELAGIRSCKTCRDRFEMVDHGTHHYALAGLLEIRRALLAANKALAAGADGKTRGTRANKLRGLNSTTRLQHVKGEPLALLQPLQDALLSELAETLEKLLDTPAGDDERHRAIAAHRQARAASAPAGAFADAPMVLACANTAALPAALREALGQLATFRSGDTVACHVELWLALDLVAEAGNRQGNGYAVEVFPDPCWDASRFQQALELWRGSANGAWGASVPSLRTIMHAMQ